MDDGSTGVTDCTEMATNAANSMHDLGQTFSQFIDNFSSPDGPTIGQVIGETVSAIGDQMAANDVCSSDGGSQ
jgi:hypothetical protein